MPTINTQDLTGAALDWAVAQAEGRKPSVYKGVVRATAHPEAPDSPPMFGPELAYSTNPAQGHPIIEREHICTFHYASDEEGQPCEPGWGAQIYSELDLCHGPTALVAAMRCWVAFKLGPTVDVPAELLQPTTA